MTSSNYSEDIEFARRLCASKDTGGDKTVQGEFLDKYKDELYFIASKLCRYTGSSEFWNFQTESGFSIRVDDDISHCIIWLVKKAAVKSCKYLGDRGAAFATFIKVVLNSDWTKTDWIRNTKGDLRAPKPIKEMGEEYIKLYQYLRKGESENIVMSKMNISLDDYDYMRSEIEDKLSLYNMLDLLRKPQHVPIGTYGEEGSEENDTEFDVEDPELTPDQHAELEEVNSMCEALFSLLTTPEQKLLTLYWTPMQVKLSVEDIFDTLSLPSFSEYKDILSIHSPEDIYSRVDEIIRNTMKMAEREFSGMLNDHKIDNKGIKTILRNFIKNLNHERLEV